jgi:hypothetical protein
MRVSDQLLFILIKNNGRLPSGPINEMGVLRLAFDLLEAREEIARLRGELDDIGYEVLEN